MKWDCIVTKATDIQGQEVEIYLNNGSTARNVGWKDKAEVVSYKEKELYNLVFIHYL